MRTFLFAAALALVGCAPDPTLGTFDFTMTGTDTQTAPSNDLTNTTGAGVLAITTGKTADYLLTLAQADLTPCTFNVARDDKTTALSLPGGQACKIGPSTAILTTSSLTIDEKAETAVLTVAYTYSGTGLFGVNYAGTGTRTYNGKRR